MTPVQQFAALVLSHPMNKHAEDSAIECGLSVGLTEGGSRLTPAGRALIGQLQDLLDDKELVNLRNRISELEDRKARRAANL